MLANSDGKSRRVCGLPIKLGEFFAEPGAMNCGPRGGVSRGLVNLGRLFELAIFGRHIGRWSDLVRQKTNPEWVKSDSIRGVTFITPNLFCV